MALTIDSDGELTTAFYLEQCRLEEERQHKIRELDAQLIQDAMKWRCLPEKVRKRLEDQYYGDA